MRPQITISYAQTLDGRLATRTGSSQWISSPEALRFAHELRARHDAIMVGIGTVLADDPRLTVRLAPGRDPLRVVLDSALRIPLTAAVLRNGAAHGTIIACATGVAPSRRAALEALGATVLALPPGPQGGVDLAALMTALRQRGIASLMVEGGARVITALLRARLADRLAVCIAPKILGEGISAIGDLGISRLADACTLHDVTVTLCGADVIVQGRLDAGA
ncbi:MAG: RibD family protein [Oscillochloridaceae bacterium]|nr:RibD family protein [Chloroflexaceae bacterium]MDW8388932.1 RibD family protein [Oscillochloridaceae bacterium]